MYGIEEEEQTYLPTVLGNKLMEGRSEPIDCDIVESRISKNPSGQASLNNRLIFRKRAFFLRKILHIWLIDLDCFSPRNFEHT